MPGANRGVQPLGIAVGVVPSSGGVLLVDDPLHRLPGRPGEAGIVIAEGMAKGDALAQGIGGDGMCVGPIGFEILGKATFSGHADIAEVEGRLEDGISKFLGKRCFATACPFSDQTRRPFIMA